ncbi:hypothetical protein VTK56DRAFT_4632 [Thermocarpiscus australiensis]
MFVRICTRPTAGGAAPLTRISASCYGRQSRAKLSCVTVNLHPSEVPAAERKEKVISDIRAQVNHRRLQPPLLGELQRELQPRRQHDDAAVILASRSIASWLTDDRFLSRLLASTSPGSPSADEAPSDLTVLCAAVDQVPRYWRRDRSFGSSEGLSVLRGAADRILPGLWEDLCSEKDARDPRARAARPWLEFRPPTFRHAGALRITVPLANTVFTNGTPHTFFVSRWEAGPRKPSFQLLDKSNKASQVIVLPPGDMGFGARTFSFVTTALVPLTKPRKIVAGLGNILRQVEIEGDPAPASKELEAIIPSLLEKRREHWATKQQPGPLGVWALIMPAGAAAGKTSDLALPDPVDLQKYDPADEMSLASQTARAMDMLLSHGCQLRRVLSGGGGWGPKQGLLSLDPQTKFGTSAQEDMEAFIKSFRGDDAAGGGGGGGGGSGFETAGPYVQFFVEMSPVTKHSKTIGVDHGFRSFRSPTVVTGTPGAAIKHLRDETCLNLFGAVSSEGIYLSSHEPLGAVSTKLDGNSPSVVSTKLDAPRSYTISSALFRE